MSVYKKDTLVESFPAYDIYQRDTYDGKFINVTVDDVLGLKHPRGFYHTFYCGSVISYALSNNDDPIAYYETAKARGEQMYWINARGAMLTAHKRDPEKVIAIEVGTLIKFEGVLFEIVPAPNDNLHLKRFVK